MRYTDRYGFKASIRWIIFGWWLVVRDSHGKQRYSHVYRSPGRAEDALLRYGSHWHRVRLFGRIDEEAL